ncbi:microtubule binding protein [Trichodelitschia bisporula]|uniref:Ribosome biogenesis protein YTM1 n=1 Tax=Trichodelitschia bisporula TaxID=703511 RepID=A0A6G1IBG1_9PEZI|nr:microtubule binding protein [Trichodelitschia bisporula]
MDIDTRTTQIRVQFTTRDDSVQLPEDTGPLLLATGLARLSLSRLVNDLLQPEKPIPFEFLVNGRFLRSTIDQFLTDNGLSAEHVLTLEYVRAQIPPQHVTSFEQDDWIAGVDVYSATSPAAQWSNSNPDTALIATAGYDGYLRVWNATGSDVLATSPDAVNGGHKASARAVRFLTADKIASAGADRTVRVWDYSGDTLTPSIELYGHTASIDALAVHAPSNSILSGSTDGNVGLWTTNKAGAPGADADLTTPFMPSQKRRKTADVRVSKRGPLALMSGHHQAISAVAFKADDHTVAYSASWDKTLRTWDLATHTLVDTRTTQNALSAMAEMAELGLVAVGSVARHITLVDVRAGAAAVAALTLRGHANTVSALAAEPGNKFGLVSGGHDGVCRIWDVRSVRAEGGGGVGECVAVVAREKARQEGKERVKAGAGVKVFDVTWDKEVGIVSVGEDRRVQINRAG